MDARTHCRYVPALVLWLAAFLALSTAQAGEPAPATPTHVQVQGGDFPVLIQSTGLPSPPASRAGEVSMPGCEAVRAKRVDELPYPWRTVVQRIHLDCQPMQTTEHADADADTDDANDADVDADTDTGIALTVTAFLKPGQVRLAGHAVAEIRLMDSEFWGDHQYVLAQPYATVAADLRAQVQTQCLQRHLRQEHALAPACDMQIHKDALYLRQDDASVIWIHADPDNPAYTIYAETWAQ